MHWLVVALLVAPALTFAAGTTEKSAAKGPMKILFIPFTMEHVFQKELCDGAKIPIPGVEANVIVEDDPMLSKPENGLLSRAL